MNATSEQVVELLRQTNFSTLDWAIVVVYLCVSLVIGVWVKQYATDMAAYIGAGRSVGVWLGVATMTGTELGLVTVMYSAQIGFTGGFAAFHIAVIAGLVTFIVGATGFVVAPLRALGVLTIPEFYERRFDRKTRVVGGVLLSVAGVLNMGLFLKMGSIFIVGVTGLSPDGGALTVVMTVLLLLVLAYTVMGGMISVIITDYIQFVLLSFGLLLTVGVAIWRLGWENIFQVVAAEKGAAGFDPLLGEGEFGPEYVLWMLVVGLIGCAVWPTTVARALAMESTQAVRRQFMWSSISFTARFLIPNFFGICAFVFFSTHSTEMRELFLLPLPGGESSAFTPSLYAMPVFLGQLLPPGVLGIVAAAMIAAFMSTHDSYLLCWSSVITQDIIAPLAKSEMTDQRRIFITRLLIVAIGGFLLFWGLFYPLEGDTIWSYMAITGAVYFTGAIPVLVGGLYWKRASTAGAFSALLMGFTALVGLEPVRQTLAKTLAPVMGDSETIAAALSAERCGLAALLLTCAMFVVMSLLFPDAQPDAGKRD